MDQQPAHYERPCEYQGGVEGVFIRGANGRLCGPIFDWPPHTGTVVLRPEDVIPQPPEPAKPTTSGSKPQ